MQITAIPGNGLQLCHTSYTVSQYDRLSQQQLIFLFYVIVIDNRGMMLITTCQYLHDNNL